MNEDIASCIAGFLGEEAWSATRSSSGHKSGAAVSIGDGTSGSSHPQPTPISSLHGIAFSKDRPFQLCHMIETYLENSGLLHHQRRDCDTGPVLSVIYTVSHGEVHFEKAYAALQERFSPLGVSFLREEEKEGFNAQLRKCLRNLSPNVLFIAFLVDDMVFFEPIPNKSALTMLFSRSDVLCVHLKLHPGVIHTHSAGGLPCARPTFKIALTRDSDNESLLSDNLAQNMGSTLLVFPHSQGTGDWNYNWDLTGGIYRRQHVIEILDTICEAYGMAGTSTPNLLESNGATLLQASRMIHESGKGPLASWPQLGACPVRPICAALTINRVQTDFPLTPIYNTEGGGIKELQNMMDAGRRLDLKMFRSIAVAYSSVHVGDLFLLPICEDDGRKTGLLIEETDVEEESVLEEDDDLPLVSVVIPVHNGGVYLRQSVSSALSQTMHKIEVIVLDDGSTDGCIDLMLQDEEISGDRRLRLKRFQVAGGLVKALNAGIQLARAAYIARLDADDIMVRDRLQRQYAFLCHDTCSNVAVVGTGVLTFSGVEEDNGNGKGKIQEVIHRVVSHPTLPALLQWSLFFSCCVAHPSVMMRRNPILDIGGYREDAFPAEDYDLWLRLSSSSSNVVVNLGEPLTLLRKHPKSLSVQNQTAQAAMAIDVAHRAIEIVLGRPVSLSYVAAMRQHQKDSTVTVSDLHGAAKLLVELAGVILSQFEKRDAVGIFYNPADTIAVKHDLRARLLELTQVCLVRFGSAASAVLRLFHQVEASMDQNE